jgi:hypothetical protein
MRLGHVLPAPLATARSSKNAASIIAVCSRQTASCTGAAQLQGVAHRCRGAMLGLLPRSLRKLRTAAGKRHVRRMQGRLCRIDMHVKELQVRRQRARGRPTVLSTASSVSLPPTETATSKRVPPTRVRSIVLCAWRGAPWVMQIKGMALLSEGEAGASKPSGTHRS